MPDGLNRAMGAQTVTGAVETAGFATATASGIALAAEYVWDLITQPFEDMESIQTNRN
jgi:hypothetical protein